MRARRVNPPHRALRGWLLALPSMGLAIAGHGLAGGGLPDLGIALPVTALLAWAGAATVTRVRGVLPLIGLLGVIQLGLHLLLTEIAGAHEGHAAGPARMNGWAMLAAHAVATVLAAALLARAGDALTLVGAALDRLRGRLEVLRPNPIVAPVAGLTGMVSAVPARPGLLLEILLRRIRSRRGPPSRS